VCWEEVEEGLPSLTLLCGSRAYTGITAGDEEELTAVPALGAFTPAPLLEGL